MTDKRNCGSCALCCKLVPVADIDKPANRWCQFAKPGSEHACTVWGTDRKPGCCTLWECLWLSQPEVTPELARPDKAHYVIDGGMDMIGVNDTKVMALQVWCDPNYPNAHRDPALRRLMERLGHAGIATLVRLGNAEGIAIFPPSMTPDGRWFEHRGPNTGRQTTPEELRAAFGDQLEIRTLPEKAE